MYESRGLILFRFIFSFTHILFLHINTICYIIECNQQLLNKTSSLSTRCCPLRMIYAIGTSKTSIDKTLYSTLA